MAARGLFADSIQRLAPLIGVALALACTSACLSSGSRSPRFVYEPEEFRAAVRARVPELSQSLVEPPFEVSEAAIELAREHIERAHLGPPRVRALIHALQADPPDGFGLRYDWRISATASRTLELRQGNCISLASVLIGIGRGLGWPMYYAVASSRHPTTYDLDEFSVVTDHMVVVVAPRSFQMIVDFTGELQEQPRIEPIDDLSAYAHFINNVAGQHLIDAGSRISDENWRIALKGFRLATRLDPDLGRAWNNTGIALTRLERFDEAREAYARALEAGTAFGSAERNLSLLETRVLGTDTIAEGDSIPGLR